MEVWLGWCCGALFRRSVSDWPFLFPLAILAGRPMTKLLFGAKPWDPIMQTIAILLLCSAALLASVIPASRAASVQPIVALRNE